VESRGYSFTADCALAARIEAHADAIQRDMGGTRLATADVLRSLVVRGLSAYESRRPRGPEQSR
jgi:hypothetical protein